MILWLMLSFVRKLNWNPDMETPKQNIKDKHPFDSKDFWMKVVLFISSLIERVDVGEWYYVKDGLVEEIVSYYLIGEIRNERKLSKS